MDLNRTVSVMAIILTLIVLEFISRGTIEAITNFITQNAQLVLITAIVFVVLYLLIRRKR